MAARILISAMILSVSELTLNNIYSDSISSFASSAIGYKLKDQHFNIKYDYMRAPLYITLQDQIINSLNIQDYEITLLSPDTIDLTISSLTTDLSFNWSYILRGTSDNGSASVKITSMSISAEIILTNSTTLTAKAGNVKVSISDLGITIEKADDINSNWVFIMFKQDISDFLVTTIQDSITSAINSWKISEMYTVINNRDLGFNYTLSSPPLITSTELKLNSIGIFVQNSNPNYYPPIPLPSPATIIPNDGVQIVITDYTINSLSYSAYIANILQFNISKENLPENFPISLTTTYLGLLIPGFIDQYGLNKEVSLSCSFQGPPEILLENATDWYVQTNAKGYAICEINVETSVALTLGLSVVGDGKFYLENWKVKGAINELKVISIDVINDSVSVNTKSLQSTINSALSSYIDSINSDYLEKGIELPTYERFNLTDANVRTGSGYLYMLVNPKVTFTIDDLFNYLG